MNADRLLELYDRISDAPDAIPRLRRFVLDLAVRGKLVEQDAADEPAAELLKRIAAERKRRIGIGELKKAKGLPAPKSADHLFKVPRTWLWTVADHVWDFENGDRGKNYPSRDQLVDSGIPFVNAGHLVNGRVNMSEMNFVTPEKFLQIGGGKLRKGDQIYCLRGSLGKHAVFDLETDAAIASSLVILRPVIPDCVPYLSLFLDSDIAVVLLRRFDNGSAQPNLSSANLRKYDIPLPPLAEQHRIVAKVDELMALCDQLEQARTGREAVRDRLTTASLARLTAPDTAPEDSPSHARFALDALPALTSRPDQIKTLRQAILNLAMRGKLVAQDPAEEPAAELLKQIGRVKAERVKSGAIPKKAEPVRDSIWERGPCPTGWTLIALGQVTDLVTSGSRGWGEFYSKTGPGFVRAQNIRFGKVRLADLACVNPPLNSEGSRTHVFQNDLLVVITGAGVTNPALLDRDLGEAYVSQHVALVRPTNTALSPWLLHCLLAEVGGRAELVERAYGAGKPGLNLNNVRNLTIPLPPLAEQHRIVAKVDALMALCDQLEASLTTTATTRSKLLDGLLHEALETALPRRSVERGCVYPAD